MAGFGITLFDGDLETRAILNRVVWVSAIHAELVGGAAFPFFWGYGAAWVRGGSRGRGMRSRRVLQRGFGVRGEGGGVLGLRRGRILGCRPLRAGFVLLGGGFSDLVKDLINFDGLCDEQLETGDARGVCDSLLDRVL